MSQIRRGRLLRLARIGTRALRIRFGSGERARPAGPLLCTLATTYRCPLNCEMCGLPERAGREIPDSELPAWVDAIGRLKPAGLGITGGEPLLRRSLEATLSRALGHGMVTHLNTSGTGLTGSRAASLLDTGLHSINVSIDHDQPGTNDLLRGRAGAHQNALKAVAILAEARDRTRHRVRIQIMTAVTLDSIDRVPAMERLARSAGADALSLLPVHEIPARSPTAPWPAGQETPAALRGAFVENSREYLEGIVPFLNGAATPGACSAPRSALFIDPTGRLFPCTPAASEGNDSSLGLPGTPDTLERIFRSGELIRTVPAGRCERCWWNCHRELDVALGIPPNGHTR
ncbi:MAG: radical SAM protein [Planctomycetota bacterium]